jgi:thioester reductase-like protein
VRELIARLHDVAGLRSSIRHAAGANRPSLRLHVPAPASPGDIEALVARGTSWQALGLAADRITGEGIGAYAAACLAGAMTLSQTLAALRAAGGGQSPDLPGDVLDGAPSPEGELRLDLTEDTLEAAVRAWSAGISVKWSGLVPAPSGPAIRLPGYPFRRGRIPLPSAGPGRDDTSPAAGPATAAPRDGIGEGLDPVILDLADGSAVGRMTVSAATIPLLAEHRVLDRLVVPGVLLIELVLRTARAAFERAGLSVAPTVTGIVIRRPLVIDADMSVDVQAEVCRPSNGRASTVVSVRAGDSWHAHLEAVCAPRSPVSPGGPASGEQAPSDVVSGELAGEQVCELAGEQVYEQGWNPSFALGDSFRLVRRLHAGGGRGRAWLAPPAPECAGIRSGVRPELLLLDAAVQLVGMAAGASGLSWRDRPVHLGTGFESLELYADTVDESVEASVVVTADGPDVVRGDVVLRESGGTLLARMNGIEFRAVSAAMLDRARRAARSPSEAGARADLPAALAHAEPATRATRLLVHLRDTLAGQLGIPADDVDVDLPLTEITDSLVLVELQTQLQDALDHDVTMEAMLDSVTLRNLAGRLVQELELPQATTAPAPQDVAAPADPRTPVPPAARTPPSTDRRTSFGTRIRLMDVTEMDALATLEAGCFPQEPPVAGQERPAAVLLTGATGFVGAFLLDTLLRTSGDDVVCLVRAEDEAHGRARLLANLAGYGLPQPEDPRRVRVVTGDLDQPRFGLSGSAFQALHDEIGDIFHNGAMVKWTYPYRGLSGANVDGTREVIRLATRGPSRPVHLTSTVGVFSSAADDRPVIGEDDNLLSSGPLAVGYAQTKWVAERMLRLAGAAGLPITIHRINSGGHSVTGAFNKLDHLSMMLKGCIESGTSPTRAAMPIQCAPIEYIARAMVALSLTKSSWGRTFHLVNPRLMSWSEIFDHLGENGYPTRRMGFDAWRNSITDRSSGTMALLGLAPFLGDMVDYVSLPTFTCDATLTALDELGVPACPPLDGSLVRTYLQGFVRDGFIPPPAGRAVEPPRPASDSPCPPGPRAPLGSTGYSTAIGD